MQIDPDVPASAAFRLFLQQWRHKIFHPNVPATPMKFFTHAVSPSLAGCFVSKMEEPLIILNLDSTFHNILVAACAHYLPSAEVL